MDENDNIKEPNSTCWWIVATLVCLVIWIGGYFLTHWLSGCNCIFQVVDGTSASALFGDSFGGVNALVSALAFAGMIVTFAFQRYELGMQRQELKAQRDEFSEQNKTLRLQRFENTFFSMMELQQNIVNDLYAEEEIKRTVFEDASDGVGRLGKEVITQYEHKGRDMFHYAFIEVKHTYHDDKNVKHEAFGLFELLYERGLKSFDAYYTTTVFDHYYRHLYTILKFIDKNEWLGKDEQYKYATFLRATLSRYELVMLYYNGFFHVKMKKLMEKYHLLNNLRTELLSLTNENFNYITKLGKTVRNVKSYGFTGRDFEMYLTDSKDDDQKYYLGAFYTDIEMDKGVEVLKKWNDFVSSSVKVEKV